MIGPFPYASGAAKAALKAGLRAFETMRMPGDPDKDHYGYEGRDDGPGIAYALLYAKGKEWVHHCEISAKKLPILVVSCCKDELPRDIPGLFILKPLTPSLWDRQAPWQPPLPPLPHDACFRPDLKYVAIDRLRINFGKGGCIS